MNSFFGSPCAAQEGNNGFSKGHKIGINIGHEQTFHGIEKNGKSKAVTLPYWGLDYNFEFSEKFAIGVHVDLITETFEVKKSFEDGKETVIERSWPVAPALMGFYKPSERWSFGIGAGAEFESAENFFLNRLAVEYGVEMQKGWEVFGVLQYDIRWEAYDTWTIGLGIGKTFRKKKAR